MKCHIARPRALLAASALCLLVSPHLRAQTAPSAATPSSDQADEAIILSPFIVDASADENGYRANSTLAGTRVRTDLKDIASAISVVTQQFLKDTNARNSADLLVYTPSTEVAGLRGNFSGVAGTGIYQENTISNTTRVRGLDSADNTRDYFLTDIPWDGFNVGRVDLQRGPNSILFGIGSPAGIINTSVNDAAFKNTRNVENQLDEWGSVRLSADINQVLVPKVLAIRIAGVKDDRKYEQKPAFNNSQRFYGALRFDPKLFSPESHTSLRIKYEDGKINSNNPRSIPPTDDVSLWFKSGKDAYGNYGYNKIVINQFNPNNPTPWGTQAAGFPSTMGGGKGGTLTNGLALSNQTRSFWPDIINYYEGTTPKNNSVANSPTPSGTPLKTIAAQPNIGMSLQNTGGGLTAQGVNPNFLPLGIPMMSVYARDVGNLGANVPGAAIPGGIYYANTVLQDPTIFDFYKLLGDGPNKHEWQKWKAFNLALDQTFFGDRLGLQVAYDHQDYVAGAEQWMAGENYAINVDINATYADGSLNPNVGRPYFGNGAAAPGLNYQNRTIREAYRFTPTYELRSEDLFGNSKWSKILGKHNFTGVFERSTVRQDYVNWAEYATTPEYPVSGSRNLNAANTLNSNRSFEWISYIGPSMATGAKSPAGAHLSNITYKIAPPKSQQAQVFNSNWNRPTNPNDPNYVNPTAAFTYTNYQTGAPVVGTQADNPANYVGWTTQNINWMDAHNPADYPSLVESANRTRFRDISRGFTWQGYFLGGDLVPTVGWRKDVITNFQTNAFTEPNSGFTSLDYNDNLSSRTDVRGESKTWGGVYHLSKWLTDKLPGESTISVFYNRSSNFKADASRLSLAGTPIPNANGQTKEYGVTITTLRDKLSLKVGRFKTKVANATLADTQGNSIGGLGNNAYFIADGSIWGWSWAADMQEGLAGNMPGNNIWDYAANDGLPRNTPAQIAAYDLYNHKGGTFVDAGGGTHSSVGGDAIVAAWLKAPFPATFFSSYSLTPPLDPTLAYKSGRLVDAYVGGIAGGFAGGIPAGGGSSFGNHQTTVDNLSSGTEVELNFQPVKNWNITMNYSKVSATHENIDPVSKSFIGTLTKFMNGPGGQVREWFNGGGTLGAQWNSSIVAPYAVLVNELGHAAPEVSPWRFNAISSYRFDHGFAKGIMIGGALRMEAGKIIGYEYDSKFVNEISSDPNYADVKALTLGGLNVNKPFKGETDTHFDMWIGYDRKITRDINWRIQLNIRDVGEKDRLTAARKNPDGSIALARIQQGMGFQLTNSFDF
ncbi:MAG: TonB-dependent receptor plug domain-containing protein [Opitutus sp.]